MNLPCLDAAREEINQRCRALGTHATFDDITTEQPDKWTLRIHVTCVSGQRFHVDVDLLDVMIEGGFVEALTGCADGRTRIQTLRLRRLQPAFRRPAPATPAAQAAAWV